MKHSRNFSTWLLSITLSLFLFVPSSLMAAKAGKTLKAVQKRGQLRCGVNQELVGFSQANSKGIWSGIDVDVCKAIAAATLGKASKVKYIPLSAQQRFTALQSKEIDILSRNTTHTLSRDTDLGLNFAPVVYYDGQGFMVKKKLGVKKAMELEGATVCVQQGTTTEQNLTDFFRSNKMKYKPLVMENVEEVTNAFFKGRCDALTADASGLASARAKSKNPDAYLVLPDVISKEPLAPVVRHDDDQWKDIVSWTIWGMIAAEEFGINSKNVKNMKKSKNPKIQRLLGVKGGMGQKLALKNNWIYEVILQVGNYGESYERNIGVSSPLRLSRGLNALWTKGGLMYSPPFR